MIFIDQFKDIIKFKLLKPDPFIQMFFPEFSIKEQVLGAARNPINKDQEFNVFEDLEVYLFVIVGAVIGSIILGIIYLLFESLRERLKNYAINKKKAFAFNGYLRGIYVSFIEMCLTVGFQVKMLINDSSYVVELQANTSYVIAGYVSVIPFVIMYWMLRNRQVLDTKEFRSKFGNMYADVHLKRSPWTIVY